MLELCQNKFDFTGILNEGCYFNIDEGEVNVTIR